MNNGTFKEGSNKKKKPHNHKLWYILEGKQMKTSSSKDYAGLFFYLLVILPPK